MCHPSCPGSSKSDSTNNSFFLVCVWGRDTCMHTCSCVCMCMGRSEVSVGCLPLSFSSWFLETGCLTEPGAYWFNQQAIEILLSCFSRADNASTWQPYLAFYVGAGGKKTQDLLLSQAALYQLSHLSSPSFFFCACVCACVLHGVFVYTHSCICALSLEMNQCSSSLLNALHLIWNRVADSVCSSVSAKLAGQQTPGILAPCPSIRIRCMHFYTYLWHVCWGIQTWIVILTH